MASDNHTNDARRVSLCDTSRSEGREREGPHVLGAVGLGRRDDPAQLVLGAGFAVLGAQGREQAGGERGSVARARLRVPAVGGDQQLARRRPPPPPPSVSRGAGAPTSSRPAARSPVARRTSAWVTRVIASSRRSPAC